MITIDKERVNDILEMFQSDFEIIPSYINADPITAKVYLSKDDTETVANELGLSISQSGYLGIYKGCAIYCKEE